MSLGTLDPITKLFFQIQDATFISTYCYVLLFGIVSFYVFMKRTQDIGKSGISSLHIMLISTILLFYWGIEGGFEAITGKMFVSETFLFIVVILYAVTLISLKFFRSSPS